MLRQIENAMELDYSKICLTDDIEPTIPVVIVDEDRLAQDGLAAIRMVGFANRAAVQMTLDTGLATFYSRTRGELWTKGSESGNVLRVNGAYTDCDSDTLLLSVTPVGPTCHTGEQSCFVTEERA